MVSGLLQVFEETLHYQWYQWFQSYCKFLRKHCNSSNINGSIAIASFWGDFALSVISMVSELLQVFEETLHYQWYQWFQSYCKFLRKLCIISDINGSRAIASFWGSIAIAVISKVPELLQVLGETLQFQKNQEYSKT